MIFQNSSHPIVIGCIDDYYCLAPRHNKSREKHKRPIKSSQREFQIGYIAMPSIQHRLLARELKFSLEFLSVNLVFLIFFFVETWLNVFALIRQGAHCIFSNLENRMKHFLALSRRFSNPFFCQAQPHCKCTYSKDPIKRAARLTIFQVFFLSIALNRACSLNYFQEIFSPARLICPARLTISF